jgi:Abnormal spindle-like microcephaly-assoc'd, ASPM-SPD-2-Hydin
MRFCSLVFALSCLMLIAADAQEVSDITITATPEVVQPVNGKLPQSLNVAVFAKDCDKGNIDLTKDSLQLTGTGLSLTQISAGKCVISAKMNIDPNAPAGNYKVLLVDGSGKPIGRADLAVQDSNAGAIPSGLAPQVDVMWEVLSQGVCNDVFGKRVARNFYCIEIKIGNNTGHPVQLAGIGFSNHVDNLPGNPMVIHANTSYASTRAVLLREEVLSPRNVFFHSVQAAGLVMAGFIPYFHNSNPKANYSTAVSIITGPLLQAINIIGPDRVVGQLNNLDDESFRDNQIIPNNSQVRTIVFVEKRALTEQLAAISAEAMSMDGDHAKKQKKGVRTEESLKAQSQTDLKQTLQTQTRGTQANSSQADANPIFRFKTGDFSPLIVKVALGNLVVIGDEIEYLQRIQVQGATAPNASSSLSLTPLQLQFGNQNVGVASTAQTVTVTNTGAAALDSFAVSTSGTNQADFSQSNTCGTSLASGTKCTITVTFTPAAQGARAATLVVAFNGGSQTVSLTGVGNGAGGAVTFNPSSVQSFASQNVGTSSAATVLTITNSGVIPLTNLAFNIAGANAADFSQTTTCGTTLAAAANCTVSVKFTPTAKGPRVATLIFTYSVGGSQLTPSFSLSGAGQ